MRHRNAGFKLGRNTSHRRALLRNLVTSVIVEDRVETTVAKAKAVRPHVEKMITLGKKGDVHSRRQALSFLMTDKAVERLFDTVAPRYGDRQGGYLRIVRTGFQKGDGAEKAFIELLGAEKQLDEKRQKRDDVKAKKRAELEKQLEDKQEGRRQGRRRSRVSVFVAFHRLSWIARAHPHRGMRPSCFCFNLATVSAMTRSSYGDQKSSFAHPLSAACSLPQLTHPFRPLRPRLPRHIRHKTSSSS